MSPDQELPGALTILSPPNKVALVPALALGWIIPYPTSEPTLRGFATLEKLFLQLLTSPGQQGLEEFAGLRVK